MYEPPVGSTTAVDVRDSSWIRTKSFRIDSAVSSSTIRVPVRPPASPVTIDRDAEPLQRTGDVDAPAAGEGDAGARPVALAELKVRHGQRPVDRGVECQCDDHENQEATW